MSPGRVIRCFIGTIDAHKQERDEKMQIQGRYAREVLDAMFHSALVHHNETEISTITADYKICYPSDDITYSEAEDWMERILVHGFQLQVSVYHEKKILYAGLSY